MEKLKSLQKVELGKLDSYWMWELDYKESWVPKNWSFWTVVLEKTLESPLDCKVKSVNPKGNQSWIFIRKTDAKAETPILWPPDVKNWLTAKDPDAGKDWRPEEKGMTEDEMVGWHHRLDGHEFELVSCSQSMESQRVGHDWATELNWSPLFLFPSHLDHHRALSRVPCACYTVGSH